MEDDEITENVDEVVEPQAPDLSAYEAKISELNTKIAELDGVITGLTDELTKSKAANYDLLTTLPADDGGDGEVGSSEPLESDIDIDDLFESKEQ